MSKLREIKSRIGGIREIEGITNAMKLVAVVRLKRIEKRTLGGRSYTEKLRDLLLTVQGEKHRTNKKRPEGTTGLIVITSQSGLCGSFNSRIIQRSEQFLKSHSCQLIVIGKKGIHYFKRKGYAVVKEYGQPKREELNEISQQISRDALSFYSENKWREVYLIYYKLKPGLLDAIVLVRLLPLEDDLERRDAAKLGVLSEAKPRTRLEFLFEPAAEEIIDDLLPECVSTQIGQALLESRCAEELERIKAMEYAADNADKLVEELTQQFNRARQTAITREIYG